MWSLFKLETEQLNWEDCGKEVHNLFLMDGDLGKKMFQKSFEITEYRNMNKSQLCMSLHKNKRKSLTQLKNVLLE